MKFKLDEHLGRRAAAVLVEAGFDVATVSDQRLERAPDREVIDRCVREEQCLVTMDAEFGNPLRFPPHHYRGIVLLRLPARVRSRHGFRREPTRHLATGRHCPPASSASA